MKKYVLLGTVIMRFFANAQDVSIELIERTNLIVRQSVNEVYGSPSGMIVLEENDVLMLLNEMTGEEIIIGLNERKIEKIKTGKPVQDIQGPAYIFNRKIISASDVALKIEDEGKIKYWDNKREFMLSGISFILKNPPHYVAFFVNDKGEPHAADTTGKIYDSAQTMALLKALDPEKYRQSRERAEELGLGDQFRANKVLVWGRTYYSTPALYEVTMPGKYAYISNSDQLQYDLQGNGYQASFHSIESSIVAVNPDGERFLKILINEHSKIMTNYKPGQLYTTSTYVGFGGNIYFYVAGEDFTEVFRIRRTWGEPDFYAMAVNGYTEDAYGTYVKKVLKGLSKEELRLLRNHLFALYGYVFKDPGLKAYFDKLVWYEGDPKATMDSIKLPPERQALLEMILAEEKKR